MSSSTNAVKRESIHLSMTDFCMTAVCMALTCIATMLIQIPIPLGYAHLGDSVILITAYLFGPVVGALAGGIGSAMADILTGYPGSTDTSDKDNNAAHCLLYFSE